MPILTINYGAHCCCCCCARIKERVGANERKRAKPSARASHSSSSNNDNKSIRSCKSSRHYLGLAALTKLGLAGAKTRLLDAAATEPTAFIRRPFIGPTNLGVGVGCSSVRGSARVVSSQPVRRSVVYCCCIYCLMFSSSALVLNSSKQKPIFNISPSSFSSSSSTSLFGLEEPRRERRPREEKQKEHRYAFFAGERAFCWLDYFWPITLRQSNLVGPVLCSRSRSHRTTTGRTTTGRRSGQRWRLGRRPI